MSSTNRLIAQTHPRLARALAGLAESGVERFLRDLINVVNSELVVDPEMVGYRNQVADGSDLKSERSSELRLLANQLDEEYFRLQDAGASEAIWSARFHQARLATAFAMMADRTSKSSVSDIVYEAAHAHSEPDAFLVQVAALLRA